MNIPQYDLTSKEAIAEMQVQLLKMRRETNRQQLVSMSSDDAFEKGYELAVADFQSLTGPDPKVEYNDAAARLLELENI